MTEKSTMVKKEFVFYALIAGLVTGFIGGSIFAVYKLGPNTVSTSAGPNTQAAAPVDQQQQQLEQQTMEAISSLEAEVTRDNNNVEAWTRLGHLYYDTGQVVKAISAYTRSLELQPRNPDVWTDLGVMYRRNQQPEKAIESFEKAYSIQPAHFPSRLNKGIVLLYDFDKPEAAIAAWQEVLDMDANAKMFNGMPLGEAIEEIRKKMQDGEAQK